MNAKPIKPNQTVKVKMSQWNIDGIPVDSVFETEFRNYAPGGTRAFVHGLKHPVKLKRIRS